MYLSNKLEEFEAYLKKNISACITKRNIVLIFLIIIFSASGLFGVGYLLGKNDSPAPIIIQQNK